MLPVSSQKTSCGGGWIGITTDPPLDCTAADSGWSTPAPTNRTRNCSTGMLGRMDSDCEAVMDAVGDAESVTVRVNDAVAVTVGV